MRGLLSAAVFVASIAAAHANISIDESRLVSLAGNTPPQALMVQNDRGRVADALPLAHMMLLLKRPAAREAVFEQLVEQLTDRSSPLYHHWLTAREIGERFGPGNEDVQTVLHWLSSHGFVVNRVYPSRLLIDFTGNAGEVRDTFQTEIHSFEANGALHISNIGDPRIPAALAPVIEGIVSLSDFHGRTASHGGPAWTVTDCGLGTRDLIPNCYFMAPPDVATVYDLGPLFKNNTSGRGQTIAVAEDSDVYSTGDWTMFRSLFGLSGYTAGSISQVHPGGCSDPGTNGDDFEATLDAEYASSAAPSAAIEVASCASSKTTWGLTIAVANLVNESSPPPLINVSYIWCEADAGAANDAAYYDAWQQAAAEGVSVFVASGDEGAATCDYGATKASHGIAVNGLASTPFDVAVGGTDFGDTYAHKDSVYWSSANSSDYGSALSYVPEIPWNSSCASELIAKYVTGSTLTYGANGFCNVSSGADFITTEAGSGGPSTCGETGSGGQCKAYPKPSWQKVFGNPNDRVRDVPDVSLFSAAPVWGHAYVVCFSDPAHDFNEPCKNFPTGWIYGYGTSFAAPIMAGMQALVNETTSATQGNPNPALYTLARGEFGSKGKASCFANLGNKIGKTCIFRDVVTGDMDVPCTSGSPNCYLPSGSIGVLSRASAKYMPAYRALHGWDFATGLGSVDAANLVGAWPK